MNIDDITVVTAFFNLCKREGGRPRNISEYMQLGHYLLDLPVKLVIFSDPDIIVDIWKYRIEKGLGDKTFIYPYQLENSPYYSNISIIEKFFNLGNRPNGLSTEKDTPLYIIVGWTRYVAIKEVSKLNPFNTKGMVWIDYGIFHLYRDRTEEIKVKLLEMLPTYQQDKIKIMLIEETNPCEIQDAKDYYCNRRCKIAAGIFGSNMDNMRWLADEFEREVINCLDSKHPSPDEALMNMIYTNYKNKFSPYYGDYHQLIPNCIHMTEGHSIIFRNIAYCRERELWDEAKLIIQYITLSIRENTVKLNKEEISILRNEISYLKNK